MNSGNYLPDETMQAKHPDIRFWGWYEALASLFDTATKQGWTKSLTHSFQR